MIAETTSHLERSSRSFAARDSLAQWLVQTRYSRVAVAWALLQSAAVGVAASVGLRACGVRSMAWRYPTAAIIAGAVFAFLMSFFAHRAGRLATSEGERIRKRANRFQFSRNDSDLPSAEKFSNNVSDITDEIEHQRCQHDLASYIVVLLALTVVLVCVYFVYLAPVLLSEMAIEGGLTGWLYRPTSFDVRSNLRIALLERIALPVIAIVLVFGVVGFGLQWFAPQAATAAEAWKHFEQQRQLKQQRCDEFRQGGLR